MLTTTRWGGDPVILTLFYNAIIRSKIDYGSSLYGSASKIHLNKIESFQNKCIRLIIGALNSTPIPALCAETGISPLQFRRNYLTDRFLIRSITYQNSNLTNNISYLLNRWRFVEWRLPLMCKRAALIFRLQNFIVLIPSYHLSAFSFHQIFERIEIHQLPRSSSSDTQDLFYSYTHQHFPLHTHIFTDGSKDHHGVGSAFWFPSNKLHCSLSLPNFTSIFHAEQMAIFQALFYIKQNFQSGHFLLISDSLSALQSISTIPSRVNPSLALSIIHLIKSMFTIQIDFLWVPGHAGIINNEIADEIAKSARSSPVSLKLLPMSEVFSLIRTSTRDDWSLNYSRSFNNQNSHYLLVQPLLPKYPWYKLFNDTPRSLIIKLSRLRFGHNRLPVHLKRINLSDSEMCPLHLDAPSEGNINHLLFECSELLTIRQNLYTEAIKLNFPTPLRSIDLLSSEHFSIFPFIFKFISELPPSINI